VDLSDPLDLDRTTTIKEEGNSPVGVRVPAMLRQGCGLGLNSGNVTEVSGGCEDVDGDQRGAVISGT
jgi:hypothetical protein